jgi:hypothetical protein
MHLAMTLRFSYYSYSGAARNDDVDYYVDGVDCVTD